MVFRACRKYIQREVVDVEPPDASLAEIANGQPLAIRAECQSEDKTSCIGDLFYPALRIDTINLSGFTARPQRPVRMPGDALRMIKAIGYNLYVVNTVSIQGRRVYISFG